MRESIVGTVGTAPSVTNQAYVVNFFKDLGQAGDRLIITTGDAAVHFKIRRAEERKDAATASGSLVAGADSATTGAKNAAMFALAARTTLELEPFDRPIDYLEVVFGSDVSATGVFFTLSRSRDESGRDLFTHRIG